MVIGLKTKNKRSTSVQVDYLIHVGEIKPWPPSQSLRSLRSVLIQWENGDRNSGSTKSVIPSLGSIIGEGKIDSSESFRLPVTLLREMSVKGDADIFQKNCLEFNLYEPRRDKAVKGQLLASAIIDLADYGIVKETLSISIPMKCKRSFKNTDQPVLSIKIQPVDKGRSGSSTRVTLSKEVSVEKNGGESVSALMDEEYAEESELASYTDDDVSSHSSLAVTSTSDSNGGLISHNEENGQYTAKRDSTAGENKEHALGSKLELTPQTSPHENLKGNLSFSSSVALSSDPGSPLNGHASESEILENLVSHSVHSFSSSIGNGNTEEESNTNMRSNDDSIQKVYDDTIANDRSGIRDEYQQNGKQTTSVENDKKKRVENGFDEEKQSTEDEVSNSFSQDAIRKQDTTGSDTLSVTSGSQGVKENGLKNDKLKHVKSVRSPLVPVWSNGLVRSTQQTEMKEVVLGDTQNSAGSFRMNDRKDAKGYLKDPRSPIFDNKIQQLEHRIKMLEGELREAAAIEASLYSVVPDHGSSMNKVYTPARRLSRLYLHACKESSQSRRANAARNAVSGLVLVAKACGNDVSRLTYWFSNSVVLRAIISQATTDPELSRSTGSSQERNGSAKGNHKISLKWKESSPSKDNKSDAYGKFGDWENPRTFVSALEKIEAWIFSRIVESIWWQNLTPHMQCAAPKAISRGESCGSKEKYGMTHSSGDQGQENISLDLWKNAFKDASERLCPVRAGGHECGCLPVLARMIMEQCVARLDVAMFNAILRESTDEIPTDPVSDPISDLKVLPIPVGTTSFGAGAQLKNVIGNWSRWLTDIFGMDDESPEAENDHEDNDERQEISFKSFRLLNALSDLMMLPKDLLLSRSIRKEVCPTFGAPLIKRVLDNFVPDEFCPDSIPNVVLEALDFEEPLDNEESVTNFPSAAAPTIYLPSSAVTIASIIGDFRNQSQLKRNESSVLRKSYTSDDELDELNSPLASIFLDGSQSSPTSKKPSWTSKQNSNQNAVRYELLRDIWTNSE